MRRALHIVSVALITAGLVIALDVAMTLLWKEPLSTVYGSIKQGQASDQLSELEDRFPSESDLRAVQSTRNPERRNAELADRFAEQVENGEGIGRIQIPRIDLDVVVVEGTTASALRAGAGHYPATPLPCEPGNVAIAGHRTTYGKPFHNLDKLRPGDTIVLETPIGSCTYRLVKPPFVVSPTDTGVVSNTPTPTLTLTTCHPKGSAAQRLIVQAELVGNAVAA